MIGKEKISTNQYDAKNIIEFFSYNNEERKAFPYINRYMSFISKKFDEIEDDGEKLKRFALAGLFLTYRACNHNGSPMTTVDINDFQSSIHTVRLKAFRDYFKAEINGIEHYLQMINFSFSDYVLMIFRLKSISRKLYKFVVK